MSRSLALCLGVLALASAGCRGKAFKDPPYHLFWDMDFQPKYHPEGESAYFADGRAMRRPPEGTIARGSFHDEDPVYTGMDPGTNQFVVRAPVPVTSKLVDRGQERFNIYCSPCHDRTGSGHGMVVQRGFHIPVDLASDHTRGLPDGEIFNIISKGVRNMPSYGYQVPVQDRWAIVSWVRVLQLSQHASIGDVPAAEQSRIEPEGGTK